MQGLKSIFESKGIWAGIVTVVIGIGGLFGLQAPECTPEVIAKYGTCPAYISEKMYAGAVAVMGVFSVIFRWVAKKQLKLSGE